MHLRSLNYFATVAETGSVSAAAERLHRSQPALSRAVQELESELGVALFVRHGRRIALSPEGWSVLREAKLVLGSADVLLERARLLSAGRSAVLRIGGAASTVERVLPPLLRTFATQRPDVEVSLTIDSGGRLLESLDRGELDVVFTRETSSETLVSRRLFPMHVVAVVPARHELARRKAVSIEDVGRFGLLIAPKNFTSRMVFEAACRSTDLRPRLILESADQNALVALAEVGYGVAVVPSTLALEHHAVKALPIRSGHRPLGVWTGLVRERKQVSTHVREFIDEAIRQLRADYPGRRLELPALARTGSEIDGEESAS